jgi:S-adenosylmethionine hydrolase
MKTITATTDFGDQFAIAQLQAVIADLGFTGKLIENHSVKQFSIIEGAFQISILSRYVPKQTVHLGVVDPGVGSCRRGIVLRTKKGWFVGPDNGLLYPAAKEQGILNAWSLKESYFGKQISNTFHGRDVFVKVAVYLAQEKKPENFGCSQINSNSLVKLKFRKGQVLHIDNFGNIKIYWPRRVKNNGLLSVKTKRKVFSVPIVKTFTDVSTKKPLALLGSSGTLELAVNLGNAQRKFGVEIGEILEMNYNKHSNHK